MNALSWRYRGRSYNGDITWSKMIMMYGQLCAYCMEEPAQSIDHVIPWNHSHCNNIENLRPCCLWCNLHASDKIFDSFSDKQNFLIRKRSSSRHALSRTVCTTCLLPYQRPHMTLSMFECPSCNPDLSDDNQKTEWSKFLSIMKMAGIHIEFHDEIRDMVYNGMKIKRAKVELGEMYLQSLLMENDDYTLFDMPSYFR